MSQPSRRRLFSRKIGTNIKTTLVGPTFIAPVLIREITLGGLKIVWKTKQPPPVEIDSRVRITLPTGPPQQTIILGGQVIWTTDTQCGIQIFYNNCTTLMYQNFLDQL